MRRRYTKSCLVGGAAGSVAIVPIAFARNAAIETRGGVRSGSISCRKQLTSSLTESEASCVVYGMPRAVTEAGLSSGDARIEDMGDAIVRHL